MHVFDIGLGDPTIPCCYGGTPTAPGTFRLRDAIPGRWEVDLRSPGSRAVMLELQVRAGSWVTANVVMHPDPTVTVTPYRLILEATIQELPGAATTVDAAITLPDLSPVKVQGLIIREGPGAPTLMCSTFQASFPPKCTHDPTLVVTGVEIDALPGVQQRGGLSWLEGFEVSGVLRRP